MMISKFVLGLVVGAVMASSSDLWASADLQTKAAEYSQFSEKIRSRKYRGGREEQSLQVQASLVKPIALRPAGTAQAETEEEHSED